MASIEVKKIERERRMKYLRSFEDCIRFEEDEVSQERGRVASSIAEVDVKRRRKRNGGGDIFRSNPVKTSILALSKFPCRAIMALTIKDPTRPATIASMNYSCPWTSLNFRRYKRPETPEPGNP